MSLQASIADCRVSECDRKTVPRCGTRNRKCSTAVCGQSVTWDHKCVLLSRPKALPWHDSAYWDDMVQQIVWCTAVQTQINATQSGTSSQCKSSCSSCERPRSNFQTLINSNGCKIPHTHQSVLTLPTTFKKSQYNSNLSTEYPPPFCVFRIQ